MRSKFLLLSLAFVTVIVLAGCIEKERVDNKLDSQLAINQQVQAELQNKAQNKVQNEIQNKIESQSQNQTDNQMQFREGSGNNTVLVNEQDNGKKDIQPPQINQPPQAAQLPQNKEKIFFGEWFVKGLAAYSNFGEVGDDEINKLKGRKITFSNDKAEFEVNLANKVSDSEHFVVNNPVYKEVSVSKDNFFKKGYVGLSQIGVNAKSIKRIDVYKKSSAQPQFSFYLRNENALVIFKGGAYIELTRSK